MLCIPSHVFTPDRKRRKSQCAYPKIKEKGNNGFEDLRKHVKQGSDFGKDVAGILQERAELEASYAKGLSKLAHKLLRSAKENVGTVAHAWALIGAEMETEGELHRALASALAADIVKPLKSTLDSQSRLRKNVESQVDKTSRLLGEWRAAEAKSKKNAFSTTKDLERLLSQLGDGRHTRRLSDKDFGKMESKRKKLEDAVKRCDHEYYMFSLRAERARADWYTAVTRGSRAFQSVEDDRLHTLHKLVQQYHTAMSDMAPPLAQGVSRLSDAVTNCDVNSDMQTIIALRASSCSAPEQMLPDFYAEDLSNHMEKDRRLQSIQKFLGLVKHDLERERRGKQGVENLARAFQETPTFGGEDSQQDVQDRLQHMRVMLAYLQACRFKLQKSLSELSQAQLPSHPLAKHISVYRDKQGLPQSVLKVPWWVRSENQDFSDNGDSSGSHSPEWWDRGTADGTSNQPDSDGSDEFSSGGSEKDFSTGVYDMVQANEKLYHSVSGMSLTGVNAVSMNGVPQAIGQCRVIYDYQANMDDELNIQTGDIISIYSKQDDGWWSGELNGLLGIFPSTYVEEIK